MNGQNQDPSSVGIFSMMPGISSDGENALSTMLSQNDRKEEFPIQFNSALIESFLKQQNGSPSIQTVQMPSDGIVPDMSQGVPNQSAYHTHPPPIPVIVPSVPNTQNRSTVTKRKVEENEGKLPEELINRDETDLTAEEKLSMKKQRRLVKNREAAQLFRQRQKEYINNLEIKAAELSNANTEANARVELLASENKLMKEQLVYLRNFMKQAVTYSFPYSTAPSIPGMAQVPTNPALSASPQLSPTSMSPSMNGNFLDEYMRIRGDMSSLGISGAPVTRPAIITTADGTSLNVNMGMLGAGAPVPMTSFPLSLLPMMTPMHPTVPSQHHSQHHHQHSMDMVPNKDDKDLLPD